ncbi:aminoglycoside phosphotransferase family protein [Amycolatopsis tucumanensis]|uniref:Aminoglycoside phosphotransferase family protein n=1 Tax=Amycolatopsis tucumanensis TaxID=401106 RepID=A0ABP7I417_9PSEU|nr:aminoglycoside phosphotransferase family protein [Amycolatopsis tucumanensis]MCF6425897.1 aminoglycoside phosphotransferase family protein [Amycolatopsis tucumanensis]
MTDTAPAFTADSTRAVLDSACRDAGLDPKGATLMRLGENALYKLASAPIVVRIARTMDYWPNVEKEVAVARWLADQGFASGRLSRPADQPRAAGGHPVTFWEFIPGEVAMPDDVALLGRELRELHRLPSPTTFTLPRTDILARIRPRVASSPVSDDDKQLLLERCEELENEVARLSFPLDECAIHGDAHIKNLMITDSGPLLIDFENFSWGQPEWDLSMTATEYVTAGWWTDKQYNDFARSYGYDIRNWEGFPTLRATHEIKMTTWIMQNVDHSPEIKAEFDTRMRTIRTGEANARWRPF